MSNLARQRFDQVGEERLLQNHLEQAPKFQDYQYQEETATTSRLEEVVFFGQLAVFCVTTVLFSFLFLSFSFPPLLTMALALPLAAGLTYILKEVALDKVQTPSSID